MKDENRQGTKVAQHLKLPCSFLFLIVIMMSLVVVLNDVEEWRKF